MTEPSPLSPAAEATLNAAWSASTDTPVAEIEAIVAAALRVLADQLSKEDDVWFEKTDGILERRAIEWISFYSIVSIARELERPLWPV